MPLRDEFLFLNYTKVTPYLIEAIQEQQKQIEELKEEIQQKEKLTEGNYEEDKPN